MHVTAEISLFLVSLRTGDAEALAHGEGNCTFLQGTA